MYTIHLLPQNITIESDNNQTVLEAMLNAGVNFPHRCQVGVCATCLCKLRHGDVRYELAPMLTEQEQQEGWIFTCLAIPASDLTLEMD
uniref:2Fe-2S iron-sulfur cluster-binding protein n=1 Tax=Thaumasiovibrio occultus TaxID=1891184 RepID=UPI000B35FA77|nr:2Fe-2S iron-sulfur cluster binding domain-containing protein [Thaumasiovibrio occultus]